MTSSRTLRVLVLGATGDIGRATVAVLVDRGHAVVAVVRRSGTNMPAGAEVRVAQATDPTSLSRDGFRGERFDAVISCLASRTGVAADAWAVDHQANLNALRAAQAAGVPHFVLLSAICVQKPRLAFQHAKLAFEQELMESGLDWSIVRPTAYFKSLSGQVARVKAGKPFLIFGDGALTACKPISDRDLGVFLADCLTDPARRNRILPIGGPGPAQTPREQGEALFRLLDRPHRFKSVPPAMLNVIAGALGALGRVFPPLAAKAELARIGRFYATESMLVWDGETGRYDPDATPEAGSDRLIDWQASLLRGEEVLKRTEQSVF
ncbi:NAD(P)H-binding protein [Brevundimonas sp.]|uniref:NAD(P)H-binding protein n=1 Tax=Brevundimonas sp. TaxID=1871086 RepID=UPI002E11DB16|nr:NAD(P)H-binding protein [Brevundimonas sp.]